MRSIWQVAMVVAMPLVMPAFVAAQPQVTARGAIIVDAETGATVWELNADQPLPPASTTKVMTAVLALQSHRLDEQFPVSARAAATPPSKIGLRPGQRVSLHDLLFAVLLKSANDAAVVVAEGVSGSEYAFAQQMNLKARVIGAMSTNFENPHGLTEGGHLVSARDLSRIFRYGLGVPGFREVLYTSSAGVEIDGPSGRYTTVRSHNRLLNAPDYKVIGKTGYTRAARRCFVGAAGYGSREIVIALLGSTDLWGDARRMLHYGLTPGRPTPVLTTARAAPPPPAAPVAPVAEYRMPPQPELRAAPPPDRAVPPPPPTPVETARPDTSAAPQAAVDRANRMARAQPDAAPAYDAAGAAPAYGAPPPDPYADGAAPAGGTPDTARPYAAAGLGAAAATAGAVAADDDSVVRDEPAPRARPQPSSQRGAPASRGRVETTSRTAPAGAARSPAPRGRAAAKTAERTTATPAKTAERTKAGAAERAPRGGRDARKDDRRRSAEVARGTPPAARPSRRAAPREPEPRGSKATPTTRASATAKQKADTRTATPKKSAGKDAEKAARVSAPRPTTAKKR